jgi:tetratricopeptide (TPR) repeat protein
MAPIHSVLDLQHRRWHRFFVIGSDLTGPAAGESAFAPRRVGLCAGIVIALAALAAYAGTFAVPFVFDDTESIANNATIRHLWRIGNVLSPPYENGQTVGGRPVLNLTIALNYAISGTQVWSYHALNLLIHILAGLTLFGIVRRTLVRAGMVRPVMTALAVALIWTVHPLQTESVTYVIQRAESLMGLFYLLTLYCFIRYAEASAGTNASLCWFSLSWLSCLLGMGTKEVMVSAPVIVFLYDRTFLSASFRKAWRRHWPAHVALATTWLPLGYWVLSTHRRGGSAGFGLGVSWWKYELTQFPAIVRYLRLSIWPHPLIFDYGAEWVTHPWSVAPDIAFVAVLVAATAIAIWRWPPMGFLGVWFFAMLSPTSLVPGNRQILAEHRMYLALAAVVTLGVIAAAPRLGRRGMAIFFVLAAVCMAMTARRNWEYRSDLALWSDTAAKRPLNPYAQTNLGVDLAGAGDAAGAMERYELALRLKPNLPEANNNLGDSLRDLGRLDEAFACYETALRARPGYADAYNNRGIAQVKAGRLPAALADFGRALKLNPDFAEAHNDLGNALRLANRPREAEVELREAIRLRPVYPDYELNLGLALVAEGRLPEAVEVYRRVLQLHPEMPDAHYHLGNALGQMGRLPEALAEFEEAVRLKPDYADARSRMAQAMQDLGLASPAPR